MDTTKDIAIFIGLIATLWGLYKGVMEYQLQGTQKRADFFLKKQSELLTNARFCTIRTLLETDSPALQDIAFDDKRAYLIFFEEIALLKNSKLINEDVAYYMFGYYAVRCYESENFWAGLNKTDLYWGVFLNFAALMQKRLRNHQECIDYRMTF